MEKLTKKDKYAMILEILGNADVDTKDTLVEFVQHEVELIDNKSAKAKVRKTEKKADEMKDAIVTLLCAAETNVNSFFVEELTERGFEEVTAAKVTSRLSSLVKEGIATKENVKVEGRTLVGYKLIG